MRKGWLQGFALVDPQSSEMNEWTSGFTCRHLAAKRLKFCRSQTFPLPAVTPAKAGVHRQARVMILGGSAR